VQAEPRPGLRRRVIAKVNAPAKQSLWAIRFVLPAGVMAAIVLLAVWLRPVTPPAQAPAPQVVQQQRTAPPPQVEARAPIASAPAPAPVARRSSPRRQPPVQFTFGKPTDHISATSVTEPTDRSAIPVESAGASAIDAPMALPPIHIAPIEVKPIVIKPIEVKPIGSGSPIR